MTTMALDQFRARLTGDAPTFRAGVPGRNGSPARRAHEGPLAQRFHPDRAKPEDKEAATWCMQEINRIWDDPQPTSP